MCMENVVPDWATGKRLALPCGCMALAQYADRVRSDMNAGRVARTYIQKHTRKPMYRTLNHVFSTDN